MHYLYMIHECILCVGYWYTYQRAQTRARGMCGHVLSIGSHAVGKRARARLSVCM